MRIDIGQLADGAVSERIGLELQKVLDNIADPNTEWKAKRKLTIELTFSPDEDRDLSRINIKTVAKLTPARDVVTKIIIDQDGRGNAVGAELKSGIKGQMMINHVNGEILDDRGQPVQQDDENSTNVVKIFR
jgi:hypothetical protein